METAEYLDRKIETASPKAVQKLQEAKLAGQLDYLFACSVFDQEKCRMAGIKRKDYRRLRDLRVNPIAL